MDWRGRGFWLGRRVSSYVLRGLCAIAGVSTGSLVRLYSIVSRPSMHLQCRRVECPGCTYPPTHSPMRALSVETASAIRWCANQCAWGAAVLPRFVRLHIKPAPWSLPFQYCIEELAFPTSPRTPSFASFPLCSALCALRSTCGAPVWRHRSRVLSCPTYGTFHCRRSSTPSPIEPHVRKHPSSLLH